MRKPRAEAADDRDVEAIEDPDGAEADDYQPLESHLGQAVEPRRDSGFDDLAGGVGLGAHGCVSFPTANRSKHRGRKHHA